MASHNSTPQSVLDAPTQTKVVISEQDGLTRKERRKHFAEYKDRKLPTSNMPHTKKESCNCGCKELSKPKLVTTDADGNLWLKEVTDATE